MTNPNALQWFKRRRGGGAGAESAIAVVLSSGAQYILGGAGSWNSAILGVLVRWVPIAKPASATLSIAMTGDFAADFNLIVASWGSPAVTGYTSAFNGAYSSAAAEACDVLQTGALGRVHSDYVRLVPGTRIELWRDGYRMSAGPGTSAAVDMGSTNALAINRRVSAATLGFGAMGFVEIRATTSALSDSQIKAACLAPVGTALPSGETNAIVGADMVGSTIAPRVGGGTYTVTGSPALGAYPMARRALGSVEIMGDSIGAGRDVTTGQGAGFRRQMVQTVNAGGRHCSTVGRFTNTVAFTQDFSPLHTSVGGMGLGATPAAGTTRLSTVATDRTIGCPPDGVTVLEFGANDVFRRIRELAESEATCLANMTADWNAEIAGLRVARTGPIVVTSMLRAATSVTTAPQRSMIDAWNAALPALVAGWNTTHGSVYYADITTAATPTQAAADDVGVLYDGTHPTPTTYAAIGVALGNALLGLP